MEEAARSRVLGLSSRSYFPFLQLEVHLVISRERFTELVPECVDIRD